MLIAGGAVIAVFLVLVLAVVNSLSKPIPKAPKAQEVIVFRPPPPPPPPPEEPPPPPPEIEEEVEVPEEVDSPEPELADSDEPPPGELLGLDADGVAGADGFGLVGRKGARGLIEGGGGGGDRYVFGRVERALQDSLAQSQDLRSQPYQVPAVLDFGADGCVRRARLRESTGDANLDALLKDRAESVCVRDVAGKVGSKSLRLDIRSR
ncbi:MAG: energy transducer TonB [Pseudomonadota bacterium]